MATCKNCAQKSCCKSTNKCKENKKKTCNFSNSCFIIVLYILLAIILAGIIYY